MSYSNDVTSAEIEPSPSQQEEENPTPIRMKNWLNAIAFVAASLSVAFAEFGFWPFAHTYLADKTAEYQTILSPRHEPKDASVLLDVFAVWAVIFVFEGIFVIGQLAIKDYRDHEIVRLTAGWFQLSCVLQAAYVWVVMLDITDFQIVPAAIVIVNFMVLMLIVGIVESTGKRTFFEYWVLRAPFSIHAGHLLCESMVYINVLMQIAADTVEDGVLVGTSMTAITAILTIMTVIAMAVPRPDGFFCLAVSWNYFWVFRELTVGTTKFRAVVPESLVSNEILKSFEYTAGSIFFIALCMAVLSFGLRLASCMQRNRV